MPFLSETVLLAKLILDELSCCNDELGDEGDSWGGDKEAKERFAFR